MRHNYVHVAPQKVQHRITIWLKSSTLKEMKAYIHTETYLKMYIAATAAAKSLQSCLTLYIAASYKRWK